MLEFIKDKLADNKEVLISFVGDSITYGLNHCGEEETFVAVFTRILADELRNTEVLRYDGYSHGEERPILGYNGPFKIGGGKGGRVTVARCGIGGNTVRRAIRRIDDFKGEMLGIKNPDLYFFMFGINDALKCDKKKFVEAPQYKSDLKELLDEVISSNPEAKIILMTPTYNEDGTKPTSHLEPYCDAMKEVAKEYNLPVIDTHALWMDHLIVGSENHGQRDWLSTVEHDCCHFSPKGAKETAKFIFKEFKKL